VALTDNDERVLRCRRLGHSVSFHYCRTQEADSLCPRILDCWWEVFEVHAFLQENLPAEKLHALAEHAPRPKVLSILDIVEQVRKSQGEAAGGRNGADGPEGPSDT